MKPVSTLFSCRLVLFFLCCFSVNLILPVSASSKTESAGYCCVNGVLQETTETICKKYSGRYYQAKDKITAEKECKPQEGYCCANGKVFRTSRQGCSQSKGSYYSSKSLAVKKCQPVKGYCCVQHSILSLTEKQCSQKKGKFYTNIKRAQGSCKKPKGYCVTGDKVIRTDHKICNSKKGSYFETKQKAEQHLKKTQGYCCVKGRVARMSKKKCQMNKGLYSTLKQKADKVCRESQGFCCVKGRVTRMSKKKCQMNKGLYATSKQKADKVCRETKGYCCVDGEISQLDQQKCRKKKGRYYKTKITAERACQASKGYCCVKGKVFAKGKKECNLVKGSYFATRGEANKQCRQSVTRLNRARPAVPTPVDISKVSANSIMATRVDRFGQPVNSNVTLSGNADRENWTVFSGRIGFSDGSLPEGQFVTLIRADGLRPATGGINGEILGDVPDSNGFFSITLPPDSSWKVTPVLVNPFAFEEITPYRINTPAAGSLVNNNFILRDLNSFSQSPGVCNVNITTVINGVPGGDFLDLHLRTKPGIMNYVPGERIIPVQPADVYNIEVPPGNYSLTPMFTSMSNYSGGMGSRDFSCDPHLSQSIDLDFDYTYVDYVSISGRVSVNGQYSSDNRVRLVRLEKIGSSAGPHQSGLDNSGGYRFSVRAESASYRLGVILNAGVGEPLPPRVLEITPGSEDIVENFDLELLGPSFSFGPLNMIEMVDNLTGSAAAVKFSILTRSRNHAEGQSFAKMVKLTMGGRSVTHECLFAIHNICEMTFPLDNVDLQNDSLTAEFAGDPGLYGPRRDYPTPFKDLVGDLMADRFWFPEPYNQDPNLSGASGYSTVLEVFTEVKNIGPNRSQACEVRLWVGHDPMESMNIRALASGASQNIHWSVPREKLSPGVVLVSRIERDCDTLSGNNVLSYTFQQQDMPPARTIMTGEGSFEWSDLAPWNW